MAIFVCLPERAPRKSLFNICLWLVMPGLCRCPWALLWLRARAAQCGSFSCCGAWAVGFVGSGAAVRRPSCPRAACGILPNHRSNQYPLCWQADSQPLSPHGNPEEELRGCRWIFYFFLQLLTTLLYILCEMLSCCTLEEAGAIFYVCYPLKST